MKKVLAIAGSDPSGGAGIQADIKTICAHRMYAMSAVTALTAQNTTGVFGVMESTPDFLTLQLSSVFTDIFPDAVKIGMVANAKLIGAIAAALKEYGAKNIVADPVMIATSGGRLFVDGAVRALVDELFPLADVITPNLAEAAALCGFPVENKDDMLRAAGEIAKTTDAAILVKGGHLSESADDLLFEGGSARWLSSRRIDTKNTHGTGCTLSSAIACGLAGGKSVYESVKAAKDYVSGALSAGLDLGRGSGPLNHLYGL